MNETKLTVEQLHILQHALGVDKYGVGVQYRNHFAAGEKDFAKCRELVTHGMMREEPPRAIYGGYPMFFVTYKGKLAVHAQSPEPPPEEKLTRAQRKYRAWLESELGMTFFEFVRWLDRDKEAAEAYGVR